MKTEKEIRKVLKSKEQELREAVEDYSDGYYPVLEADIDTLKWVLEDSEEKQNATEKEKKVYLL